MIGLCIGMGMSVLGIIMYYKKFALDVPLICSFKDLHLRVKIAIGLIVIGSILTMCSILYITKCYA